MEAMATLTRNFRVLWFGSLITDLGNAMTLPFIVLYIQTGDLDRAGERAIVARYPQLRVDVLKLGHHGSKTASDPLALRQLGVHHGILSVGRHNRYGHPNQETLITLAEQHIVTYSTALQGMITYRFVNHRQGRWQTFLKEGDRHQRTTGVKIDSQR